MQLYTYNLEDTEKPLNKRSEIDFKSEKEIHSLFENYLTNIMELSLVKSEYTIGGKRIDTLAYDNKNKVFCIIEYKKKSNKSQIGQIVEYLAKIKDNQDQFINDIINIYLENENLITQVLKHSPKDAKQIVLGNIKHVAKDYFKLQETKLILVAPRFSDSDIKTYDIFKTSIEFYEVKKYEGGIISINQIGQSESTPSFIQPEKTSPETEAPYYEEYLLEGKSEYIKELYEDFEEAILKLSSGIEIVPRKHHIAFKKGSNIASIVLQEGNIDIYINLKKGKFNDPKGLAEDFSNIGHWGTGHCRVRVKDTKDLEYIMSLVKQAIKN